MGDTHKCVTIFVSNISHRSTKQIIYELFVQGGPIESCTIREKYKSEPVAIVEFKYEESVPYAMDIFNGTVLHGRELMMTTTDPWQLPVFNNSNQDWEPVHDRRYHDDRRHRDYDRRRSIEDEPLRRNDHHERRYQPRMHRSENRRNYRY